MTNRGWSSRAGLALLVLIACAPARRQLYIGAPATASTPSSAPTTTAIGAVVVASLPLESRATTQVAVLDPQQLRALEARGFAFARLAVDNVADTTAEISSVPQLRGLFETLRRDVQAAARPYPLARVTSIDGFRLFDARFLSSAETRFELVGVFNRLDRRAFYVSNCGEVRFLYRLAYRTTQGGVAMASRLPMTLNVVFWVDAKDDPGCRNAARAWQSPTGVTPGELVGWLVDSGPLSVAARARLHLKSIESNVQTFRIQSSVMPALGGHIEYGLRVFHPLDEARTAFEPAPMENMPDVPALKRDAALRKELLAELQRPEALAALDRGTLQLPDRFLAKQAMSVAPRGLERRQNRPFSQLFSASDFASNELSKYQTIRSPAALLRRLDGASCVGCHQSRSIAGFHHVGRDAVDEPAFNALRSGSSTHLLADLERREHYVAALAAGEAPDEFRPNPERQGVGHGQGAPCGLGDAGFADWKCDAGFQCQRVEDDELGTCLADGAVGAPCEFGSVVTGSAPQRDRVTHLTKHACATGQACATNFSAFPQGACTAACNAGAPNEACGRYLDVDGFQNCLRGTETYAACANKFAYGLGVQACDEQHACRQDFVCTRTTSGQQGACLPPYFVFQLRLDGYPLKH